MDCPFGVKVSIPDLNIRKSSGINTAKTGISWWRSSMKFSLIIFLQFVSERGFGI